CTIAGGLFYGGERAGARFRNLRQSDGTKIPMSTWAGFQNKNSNQVSSRKTAFHERPCPQIKDHKLKILPISPRPSGFVDFYTDVIEFPASRDIARTKCLLLGVDPCRKSGA